MIPRVGFRTTHFKDTGLRRAPTILGNNLKGTLEGIGKRLKASSIARMREDLGNERRSLTIKVRGTGTSLRLEVISLLAQAFTDAYGLKRGTFPPFGPTSRLFSWALRRQEKWTFHNPKNAKKKSGKEKVRAARKLVAKRRRAKTKIKSTRVFKQSLIPRSKRNSARNYKAARIAFLVARAIYRRGIKPTFWNVKALEANRRQIIRDLQNGLERAAREINRG